MINDRGNPPVISIVGLSDTGKTTFIEKLIPRLKDLDLKVAVVKHDVHGFEIDTPGKDSWRFGHAGADGYSVASPARLAVIKRLDGELDPSDIAAIHFSDCDVVLTEGYKRLSFPKIEVYRNALGRPPLCTADELIAMVSDVTLFEGLPTFGLDAADAVASFIKEYISQAG